MSKFSVLLLSLAALAATGSVPALADSMAAHRPAQTHAQGAMASGAMTSDHMTTGHKPKHAPAKHKPAKAATTGAMSSTSGMMSTGPHK